jgi:hypothetical protein
LRAVNSKGMNGSLESAHLVNGATAATAVIGGLWSLASRDITKTSRRVTR